MAKKLTMQDLFGAPQGAKPQDQSVGLKGIVKGGNLKASKPAYAEVQYQNLDKPGKNKSQGELDEQEAKIKKLEAEVAQLKALVAKTQAQGQAEKIEAERAAKSKGLSEGESMGEARATAVFEGQLGEIRTQIGQLLEALSGEKEAFFKQVEFGCRELITEGLKKLNHELDNRDEQVIEKVVKNVFSLLGNESQLLLRLSPADYHMAKDQVNLWLPLDSNGVEVQVVEDPRINQGGCRLETEAGAIDALRSKMSDQLTEIIGQAFDAMFGNVDEGEQPSAEHSGVENSTPQGNQPPADNNGAAQSNTAQGGDSNPENPENPGA